MTLSHTPPDTCVCHWSHPGPVAAALPERGSIDIHAHLIPGIDDGCQSIEQTLDSVRTLMAHGYVGSVCTPHYWPELFPHVTPSHIDAWVQQLRTTLADEGIDYALWPGAEVRLFPGSIDRFERDGVPTLAHSRCVLFDLWENERPDYLDAALDYLFARGYQPVMAHPERLGFLQKQPEAADDLIARGLWMQGNLRCLTGGEGPAPDALVRKLLREGRYAFMALDLHRPDTLIQRLEGRDFLRHEFGEAQLERLTSAQPRLHLLREMN